MGRALFMFLVGSLAGIVSFMISEPFAARATTDQEWARHSSVFGVVSGILIASFLGMASGHAQGSRTHLLRGLGAGVLMGFIFGPIGIAFGNALFATLGGQGGSYISRVIGWTGFGAFIGLGAAATEGIVARSLIRTYQAVVGGLLGGLAGGFAFETAAMVFGKSLASVQGSGDVAGPSRAMGLTLLGGGIGLLIGIIEALSKRAWVRLVLGRNEGKEWAIDVPHAVIGRSETAHIPLFGDPNVAPHHASIVKQGGHFLLVDAGTPIGVGLNGARVQQVALNHGDMINIGGLNLEFRLKAGRSPQMAPEMLRGGYGAGPQMPQPMQPTQMPMQPMPTQAMPVQNQSFPTQAFPTQGVQAQSFTLVATTGPLTGQRFPVTTRLELGREMPTIPMSFDTMASRRHASLEPSHSGLMVTDLGSKNGTTVNGQRISQQIAQRGDTVQIGTTAFRIE